MRLTKEWQRRPQPWPQPRQGRQEGLFHTCAIGSQVLPPFNLYNVVSRPASQILLMHPFETKLVNLQAPITAEDDLAIPKNFWSM